jgi:hypothetical protein
MRTCAVLQFTASFTQTLNLFEGIGQLREVHLYQNHLVEVSTLAVQQLLLWFCLLSLETIWYRLTLGHQFSIDVLTSQSLVSLVRSSLQSSELQIFHDEVYISTSPRAELFSVLSSFIFNAALLIASGFAHLHSFCFLANIWSMAPLNNMLKYLVGPRRPLAPTGNAGPYTDGASRPGVDAANECRSSTLKPTEGRARSASALCCA